MTLSLDPTSTLPPSEQVRAAIEAGVADGTLPVGTRLPTVRGLATDLGLAANTVAKAYRELERSGVVETRGRAGTYVAVPGADASRELRAAAHAYVQRARQLGSDDAAALAAVTAELRG